MSTEHADEFLTVAEVAKLLKVNEQTVRNWIDRGNLRAVRVGARRVRVHRVDLDAYVGEGGTPVPVADVEDARAEFTRAFNMAYVSLSEDDARLAAALRLLARASARLARELSDQSNG